jgi:polyisoprenoid-binding protein YceI
MSQSKFSAGAGLLLGLSLGLAALGPIAAAAQAPGAPATPPRPNVITKDPASAVAGTYRLDKGHSAVIARVPHQGGYSFNVLRFGVDDGSLTWDPAHLEAAKLTVTVDMAPKTDPVVYAQDLKGPNFMNAVQFPTATFVSTQVRRTGPTTGQVMGNLTFLGLTKPVVIDTQLVGAGRTGAGVPTIGFQGVMKIKRDDFGLKFMGAGPADTIEVSLDVVFTAQPAA